MAQDRLGAERMGGAYAWRDLIKSGARMAAGSDFPVEPPNPFYGWHAAVTRQDRQDEPPGGWRPWDVLTRLEAFRLFTLDAAYAGHQENVIGTLEAGKWADFILVNQDPFTVPAQDIWKTKVLQTWLAGRQVYPAETKISIKPLQD
jgi:predicted amidohydrolase YtcJ